MNPRTYRLYDIQVFHYQMPDFVIFERKSLEVKDAVTLIKKFGLRSNTSTLYKMEPYDISTNVIQKLPDDEFFGSDMGPHKLKVTAK